MSLTENLSDGAVAVLAGVVIELILWGGRQLRRRLPIDPPELPGPDTKEHMRMGRPGQLTKPNLPPGSHRDLISLLHHLHLLAGLLSVRTIAELARRSPSTVHKALTGTELPDLHVVMAIALVLADAARSDDRDRILDDVDSRVEAMWLEAQREGRPPAPKTVQSVVEETWAEFSRGENPWANVILNPVDYSQLARCPILSVSLRSGLVTVLVSTPDWDALGTVEDPQEWHLLFQTAVIKKLDYFLHVWIKLVPGFDTVANPCPRLTPVAPRTA
ncbi:hypothetical protein ACTU45_18935 [Streptomyces sp. 24-1644]|nr:hypothetical protein [Streptomyces sp. NBC_01669]MCX4536508.1 hypothetical protein [Streptomyces sp. NBC_01669]